jgi:hypothetical protein
MKQAAGFVFFGACVFGLFFLALGLYMGYQYRRQVAVTVAYHADPAAAATSARTSST